MSDRREKDVFLNELRKNTDKKINKYRRNYARYFSTLINDITNLKNAYPLGMNQIDPSQESDTTSSPSTNVVKSVIDTLVSKIASTKVRPFFTPVDSGWETRKILRQMQKFFDDYFDRNDVNKKVTYAFRDACIFDTGALFLDPFTYGIDKIAPWQFAVIDAEAEYGSITKLLIQFQDYPTSLLKKFGLKLENRMYCNLELFFDTSDNTIEIYIDKSLKKTVPYKHDDMPIILLHFCHPVTGRRTISIIDELRGIQAEIDILNAKIKEASQLTPANMFFVPDGTNLQVESLNNRTGNVVRYKPIQGVNSPVEVAAPSFISDQYKQLLDYYIQQAYEMVGISTLSSQSKKPSGLDSGVALQSMENIENDRFETQLNNVIRAYVDIAKTMIRIFPENANVLPEEVGRSSIQWADVVEQNNLINIQYSAADAFSKDPNQKLQQLLQMSQAGMIQQNRIASLIELPDLNNSFTMATAATDAVDQCIENALDNDIYEIPRYISYQLLEQEIATVQNMLFAASGQEIYLERINKLDTLLQSEMVKYGFVDISNTEEMMIAENGMASQGVALAPTASDAGEILGPTIVGAENDTNIQGDVMTRPMNPSAQAPP